METQRMTEQAQAATPGRDESKPRKTSLQLAEERKAKAEQSIALHKARETFRTKRDSLAKDMRNATDAKSRSHAAQVLADFSDAYNELMDLEIPE